MTGVEMIAAERERQINEKGWTTEHDDQHDDGSLLEFADMLLQATATASGPDDVDDEPDSWVPDAVRHVLERHRDPVERLRIASALVAAEIDRIQRVDRV